jgi:hypothetical protein
MSKSNQLKKTVHQACEQRLYGEIEQPWLASNRLRFGEPLLVRFQHYYQILRSLPRRTRRRMKRRWAMSLGTAALLLALSSAPTLQTIHASTVSGDSQIVKVQAQAGSLYQGRDIANLASQPAQSASRPTIVPAISEGPGSIIVVNGNNSGSDCTLDDAIVAANTNSATGNCIAGTGDDILDIQVNVNLTAPAPVISSTMTIEGNSNSIAGDDTFGPLLHVIASGDLTLNDATVRDGYSAVRGGGIYVNYGHAEINDTLLTSNFAAQAGGGISAQMGSLEMNNSQSIDNAAFNAAGVSVRYSTATITGSTISGNQASGYYGGLYTNRYSSLHVMNSTISGNDAGGGGAIGAGSESYMRIDNSTINGNTGNYYSGGLNSASGSTVILNNSTVSNNSTPSDAGGGVYVGYDLPSTMIINDSTITGNSAGGGGGGVLVRLGSVTINRSLISGNTNSVDGLASDVENEDSITVDNYNLFGHDGQTSAESIGGFTAGASDILATSDGTLPTALTDILDTVLQNNGGTTETHALPVTSPAVEGVLDGSCASNNEDQRHLPRGNGAGMGGSLCDIGAFEVQDAIPTAVVIEAFDATVHTDGSVMLDWTTSAEVNHAGFNVYRSLDSAWDAATATQLNAQLIAAQGSAGSGAAYSFADAPAPGAYTYFLESVETSGVTRIEVSAEANTQAPTSIALTNLDGAGSQSLLTVASMIGLASIAVASVARNKRRS